jgi:membrane-bound serine protease (ClpP class)
MFFVVALLVLLLLPSPWNVIASVVSLAIAFGEVGFWQRKVRKRQVVAGAETLIGSRGTVVRALRPTGQVRVSGELWEATSESGADPGEEVTVVGRDGLTLVVEPDAPAAG